MHGVRFPQLRGSLHVRLGDLSCSWALWDLVLAQGTLSAEGHGVLPLCHAAAVEIAQVRDGGGGDEQLEAEAEEESDDDRSVSSAATSHRADAHLAEISISLVPGELAAQITPGGEHAFALGGGGGGGGGAALPPLLLRGAAAVMLRWHAALSSTCSLLQDVGGGGQWSGSRAFAPLEAELLEQQHNNLFDACFELCAHDTHGALVEMSGPLWSACAARLRDARGSMPPRPDVFAREAEGIHRRYYSMVHALLMRHDLDGSGLGHSPGTEPLAPKLMLRLIGWSHQYQRRMARLGAGGDRALLCDDTTETVITAYIANTRSVSQQLSKNIIFCEQQTMLQRNEKVGDGSKGGELSAGILLLDADGSYGAASPGGTSSKLYYTEMHIDVFRIVHEQVELAMATTMEPLVFNALLSAAG